MMDINRKDIFFNITHNFLYTHKTKIRMKLLISINRLR